MDASGHTLAVPVDRLERWIDGFQRGRSDLRWVLDPEGRGLSARTSDGSRFTVWLPFGADFCLRADEPDPVQRFLDEVDIPDEWGVLLVRKGGFAIARMQGTAMVEHKVGQRHVQGRTKAGGQSQQRFARRRENQARQAYEAAAGHAQRILRPLPAEAPVVVAGDETGVKETLAAARLEHLRLVSVPGSVAEPRRAVLDQVIQRAQQCTVHVVNAAS